MIFKQFAHRVLNGAGEGSRTLFLTLARLHNGHYTTPAGPALRENPKSEITNPKQTLIFKIQIPKHCYSSVKTAKSQPQPATRPISFSRSPPDRPANNPLSPNNHRRRFPAIFPPFRQCLNWKAQSLLPSCPTRLPAIFSAS